MEERKVGRRVRVKILWMFIEVIFEWTIFDTRYRHNVLTVKNFKVYYCFFSYSLQPYCFLRDVYRHVWHVYFSKRPSFTLSFTSINRVFITSNFSVIKTQPGVLSSIHMIHLIQYYLAPVRKSLLQAHHDRCCSLVKLLCIYFCYLNLLNHG